jgi:hypothetical protein
MSTLFCINIRWGFLLIFSIFIIGIPGLLICATNNKKQHPIKVDKLLQKNSYDSTRNNNHSSAIQSIEECTYDVTYSSNGTEMTKPGKYQNEYFKRITHYNLLGKISAIEYYEFEHEIYFREKYFYNNIHNISKIVGTSEGQNNLQIHQYIYNKQKQLNKIKTYNSNGHLIDYESIELSKNGEIAKTSSFEASGEPVYRYAKHLFTYNSQHLVKRESVFFPKGKNAFIDEFTYNEKKLEYIRKRYFIEKGVKVLKVTVCHQYNYDENGNWIKKSYYSDNELFKIETRKITYR